MCVPSSSAAENVCEGFDHADAVPLSGESLEEAARQLRYANKMTQLRLLSSTQRISKQEADWAEQVRCSGLPTRV